MKRLLVVTVAVVLPACSGATPNDFFDPVADDSSLTVPTDGETGPRAPDKSNGEGDDGAGRDPSLDDAEEKLDEDGPHDLPTPNACATEAEPNQTDASATKFAGCINGVLDDGSDVDVLMVSAPPGTSRMHIRHEDSDKISYRVSDTGFPDTFPFVVAFSNEDGQIDVVPGRSYRIRLSVPWGGKKDARSYVVTVDFE